MHVLSDESLGDPAGTLTFNNLAQLFALEGFTSARRVILGGLGGAIRVNKEVLELSGVISGTGALLKAREGTLLLSGLNTYSGGTLLAEGSVRVSRDANLGASSSNLDFRGGTLEITSSFSSARRTLLTTGGTVDVHPNVTFALSGLISGAGFVVKQGAGVFRLSGANTYSGNTVVEGGTLELASGGTLGSSKNLEIRSGRVVIPAGAGTKQIGVLRGSGSLLDASDNLIEVASGEFGGEIAGSSAVLQKSGSGLLKLFGTNTYGGKTVIDGGVLSVGAESHLGNVSASLEFDGGSLLTTQGFLSSRALLFRQDGMIDVEGSTLTLSGVLSGSGKLLKRGAGTLVLEGTNTYTGETRLFDGILNVSEDRNLGASSSSLVFNGGKLLLTDGFTSSRNISFAGSAEIEVNKGVVQVSGVLSGSGSLKKSGEGRLELSGVNTYSGGTLLEGGVLTLSADHNLGTSGSDLTFDGGMMAAASGFASSRNLLFTKKGQIRVEAGGAPLTLSAILSGEGGLEKSGGGTLVLDGINTFGGGIYLLGGRLSVDSDQNLGKKGFDLYLDGGTLLTTSQFVSDRNLSLISKGGIEVSGNSLTLSGVLSGEGALTKSGGGNSLYSG